MTKEEIAKKTIEAIRANRSIKILESKNYLNSLYKDNEILELSNRYGALKVATAKSEVEGLNSSNLQKERDLIKKQFLEKIIEKGYDVNKLIPKFDCPLCNDRGILSNGEMCSCFNKLYYENLLKETMCDLSRYSVLDRVNLDRYEDKQNKEKMIDTLKNLQTNDKNTILFSGATGTGKTYLAKCFLKTYILKNNLGRIYSSSEINKIFVDAFKHYLNADQILFDVLDADILIIDDLGAEAMYNNITKEYFLTILNERQGNNKITLFTTNLTLNDIKTRYNERFFSRLMDNEISLKYNFQGKDLRLN